MPSPKYLIDSTPMCCNVSWSHVIWEYFSLCLVSVTHGKPCHAPGWIRNLRKCHIAPYINTLGNHTSMS